MKFTKHPHPALPYIVPFVTFLAFTGLASYTPISSLWLYPLKTIITGILLIWFRKSYSEIKPKLSLLSFLTGLLVFAIWIIPTGYYPLLGNPINISPYELAGSSQIVAYIWICFRMIGAVIVVSIMEELFWRSFLIRYLINPDFKSVPIGKFSWLSLIGTVILFGVEHNQWLPGIIAGILYTLLLYRTKSLFACIFAHSITNLALGIYVLLTHQWVYW
jgi:CAAX prenyl protease-like protein